MARRAKFGRIPRVQQNLSSTLVAIAHEMVARQDANIMDAWKNGGEFEGKKVTDEVVLAYWQKRSKNLDKADPLYDTYQNQIEQLHYGIEQSKMDLAHLQGKISDSQYADFFLKWAKRAPKNSEWWRSLQKDAAQLLEQAKAKAVANANKRKQDAFNAFVKDQNKDIGLGSALTDAVAQLSKDTGLSVTGNGDRLLGLLTEDYKAHPEKYHALTDAIKTSGVDFTSGVFTPSFFRTSVENSEAAYDKVATRANKDGYASAYASATKGQADMGSWATNMNVWPVAKAYDRAFALMQKTVGDPNASQMDKNAALAQFSATATTLSKTEGIDTASMTMLQADAARALGQDAGDSPSFGSTMLGHSGITPEMQAAVAYQTAAETAMAATPGAYQYAPVDKNGNFDPTGQGPVGIVPTGSIPSGTVFVAQPGLNGTARMVAVLPHDVQVSDPNNPDAAPTTIGKVLSYQIGGQTVTLYGYGDSTNGAHWTSRSPWADGVTGAVDKDGNLQLTLPQAGATDPKVQAAAIEKQYPGLKLVDNIGLLNTTDPSAKASGETYTRDAKGNITGHVEVTYQPGKGFTLTQAQVTRDSTGKETLGNQITTAIGNSTEQGLQAAATAPSVYTGGSTIPGVFDSPAAASVDVTQAHMSAGQVSALAQDPNFQHAFLQQTMQTLDTTNPLDPRVVAAWDQATKVATQPTLIPGVGYGTRLPNGRVIDRTDLSFPGVAPKDDPTKTQATISFMGQELKLPGLPAYLNNAQGQGPNVDLNGLNPYIKAGGDFLSQVLGWGAPAVKPPVTPTVNPATGFTVTPTGTPTAVPKKTTTPTPTTQAAPTASPPASTPPPTYPKHDLL